MSDPTLRVPSTPPPKTPEPPRTKSGQHPAVAAYRKKLDSLREQSRKIEDLDRELASYLDSVRPTEPAPKGQ